MERIDWNRYGPGRPYSIPTVKLLNKMAQAVHEAGEPIRSAKLAKDLNISSQRAAQLSRVLGEKGVVHVENAGGFLLLSKPHGQDQTASGL